MQLDIARMTGMTPRKEQQGPVKDSARGTQGGLFVYKSRVVRQRQTMRGRVQLVELVEVGSGSVVYQGEGVPLADMIVLTSGSEDQDPRERRREELEGQRKAIPQTKPRQVS